MQNVTYDVEITTKCRLACPKCPRIINSKIKKQWDKEDMTLLAWKSLIDGINIKKILLCGCYGDCIYHPLLFEFIKYRNNKRDDLIISIETNGSHREPVWWEELGYFLRDDDEIVFSIDGLKSTNQLYRVGSNFDSIVSGIQSFRKKFNGKMIWKYIIFNHNEHQIKEAKNLSKELGFSDFFLVYSSRYDDTDQPTHNIDYYENLLNEKNHA
jgi:MoaA/NifB/PqqE/SkfB family radical SAM enzyme